MDQFVKYYEKESITAKAMNRFEGIKNAVLRVKAKFGENFNRSTYDIADIGCNAGTQSILWAKEGHHVYGIDINSQLLEIAQKRAMEENLDIEFKCCSATKIPLSVSSVDFCLVPELLEHVNEWDKCLDEFSRILRPGGVLFISTSNRLCPFQQEFKLPLYSWYPKGIKRYYEKLAVTTKPQLVNFAKYPAINWFTFYQLRDELKKRSFISYDRFDAMNIDEFNFLKKQIAKILNLNELTKLLGHFVTPGTTIFGIKK
ncbi:class I SAM-dependent methyltransferase [uncultured Desulfobacter sp.]|uniref:class I SAM-dependent methyltransferase n=1 Tax=uncultured Desulfobacter sp. TaxID=240139 RepID=UPI0029C71DC1|nr:class I SAM-dependent methyltransferase [uncultured Desulfobacter sp.]